MAATLEFVDNASKDKALFDRLVYALRGSMLAKVTIEHLNLGKDEQNRESETEVHSEIMDVTRRYFTKAAQGGGDEKEWAEFGSLVVEGVRKYRSQECQKVADSLLKLELPAQLMKRSWGGEFNRDFVDEVWKLCYVLLAEIWKYAFGLSDMTGLEDPDRDHPDIKHDELSVNRILSVPFPITERYMVGIKFSDIKGKVTQGINKYVFKGKREANSKVAIRVKPNSSAVNYGRDFSDKYYHSPRLERVKGQTDEPNIRIMLAFHQPPNYLITHIPPSGFLDFLLFRFKTSMKGKFIDAGIEFSSSLWNKNEENKQHLTLQKLVTEEGFFAIPFTNAKSPLNLSLTVGSRSQILSTDSLLLKGDESKAVHYLVAKARKESNVSFPISLSFKDVKIPNSAKYKPNTDADFERGDVLLYRNNCSFFFDGKTFNFFVNFFCQLILYNSAFDYTENTLMAKVKNSGIMSSAAEYIIVCKEIDLCFPTDQKQFFNLSGI